jgi:hypothetical protein
VRASVQCLYAKDQSLIQLDSTGARTGARTGAYIYLSPYIAIAPLLVVVYSVGVIVALSLLCHIHIAIL